jgi:hypothetical protein
VRDEALRLRSGQASATKNERQDEQDAGLKPPALHLNLRLEADDGFAAEAAGAELFDDLGGAVQINGGADARSDDAVGKHARDLVQPLRRGRGIVGARNVERRDFALGEPLFVRCVDGRDEAASRFENFSVAGDGVLAVDEIEDRVHAVGVSGVQRAYYVHGFGVVNFFGTEAASFAGVAANGGEDVRAAGARHLHRVAADAARRAHYDDALARGKVQQLERAERSDCGDGQRGCLFVGDGVGYMGERLCVHTRCDRRVLAVGAMRPRHAEDSVADAEIARSRRNAFDDAREIRAQDKRICRGGGQPVDEFVVDGIDAGILHADEERAGIGGDRQIEDRGGCTEAPDGKCAHGVAPYAGANPANAMRDGFVSIHFTWMRVEGLSGKVKTEAFKPLRDDIKARRFKNLYRVL